MMVPMRPVARSLVVSLVALVALVAADSATAAPPEPTRQEHVDQLWLDAKGESGWIRTTPLYLDQATGEYHFGAAFCGKGHRLGSETLRLLQGALAQGLPVRIDAEPRPSKDGERQCVTGVAVFAPLP